MGLEAKVWAELDGHSGESYCRTRHYSLSQEPEWMAMWRWQRRDQLQMASLIATGDQTEPMENPLLRRTLPTLLGTKLWTGYWIAEAHGQTSNL